MTEDGFSLVELLVVIAIVALLAALILPGLARAREYAYFTRCKSNLRQIGIGVLMFAGGNKGKLPGGETKCSVRGLDLTRKIGDIGSVECIRERPSSEYRGKPLIRDIYDDSSGEDWDGTDTSYVGKPRLPGKYLPIEILWDPLCKIRGWGPYGRDANRGYADTEEGRDYLTRRRLFFGYTHFMNNVGCDLNMHILSNTGTSITNTEYPFRPATKHRNLHTSALPSAWIAACQPGLTSFNGVPRNMTSHFGFKKPLPDLWRFNNLHMDGHVDSSVWKECRSEPRYGADEYGIGWLANWQHSGSGWCDPRPYGWRWMTNPAGDRDGVEPDLDGGFDFNQ